MKAAIKGPSSIPEPGAMSPGVGGNNVAVGDDVAVGEDPETVAFGVGVGVGGCGWPNNAKRLTLLTLVCAVLPIKSIEVESSVQAPNVVSYLAKTSLPGLPSAAVMSASV